MPIPKKVFQGSGWVTNIPCNHRPELCVPQAAQVLPPQQGGTATSEHPCLSSSAEPPLLTRTCSFKKCSVRQGHCQSGRSISADGIIYLLTAALGGAGRGSVPQLPPVPASASVWGSKVGRADFQDQISLHFKKSFSSA